jgi:carbon-monoxide dehydrogenase small subunit
MSAKERPHVERVPLNFTVNGTDYSLLMEPRMLLADVLRSRLGLTGTHVGCEQGVCGSCTVRVDGKLARSCLMLAVQADGMHVETVESLGDPTNLHPLQEAFRQNHALQCGYCTPGFLIATMTLLESNPDPSETEIREYLRGQLCRCTGYAGIVAAVQTVAADRRRHRDQRA